MNKYSLCINKSYDNSRFKIIYEGFLYLGLSKVILYQSGKIFIENRILTVMKYEITFMFHTMTLI